MLCSTLFLGCVLHSFAQKKDSLQLAQSYFYSETEIYIEANSILTLQTSNIILKEAISGEGTLQISKLPLVKLRAQKEISVATIEVVNTTLSLQSTLKVAGMFVLDNAILQLNNFNVHTQNPITFLGNAMLLFNGTGKLYLHNILQQNSQQPIKPQPVEALSSVASKNSNNISLTGLNSLENTIIFFKPISFDSIGVGVEHPPPKCKLS